ncbi:cytosine specific methyltransferase [Caudoviricetes sp.]|nr:cytosine specific methyltransferase [Caudoviricetes sp.]
MNIGKTVKYLSVCSGIEAATVAWHDLGWKAVGFSEIEKFPSQVLEHHYPEVPNLGDMTKYKEWNLGAVNLLVGGTPCQSFSVAGLRKGLEDPRGNLMLTYCGILDRFRPDWFVWENVPGVLSSNGGRDFGSFLGAVAELGYGFAYRVLDAQYFGVAQRRRRVFVVGCFGDWESAAKVLFEPESLRRDTKKSRKTREETAKRLTTGIGSRLDAESDTFVTCFEPRSPDGHARVIGDISPTLNTMGGGQRQPCVAYSLQGAGVTSQNANGSGYKEEQSFTLNVTDVHGVAYGFEPGIAKREGNPARFIENKTPTIRANMGDNQTSMASSMAVRRLTPIECERLQGFPDNYTDIKPKGKETPDGPRYKALGNSMAVPVMRWIGKRINEQSRH